MKRIIVSIVLGGVVACLIFAGLVSRGGRPSLASKVHAQEGCSVATLHGAYGFFRTGTVSAGTTSAGPLAAVGIATFDGTGAVSTARQTIRRIGVTTSDLFITPAGVGPYQVDPDCGLRLLNPDGSVLGHGVVVSGGKELFILSLSDSNSVYGVMKKISTED
jgi:hypothetical protein